MVNKNCKESVLFVTNNAGFCFLMQIGGTQRTTWRFNILILPRELPNYCSMLITIPPDLITQPSNPTSRNFTDSWTGSLWRRLMRTYMLAVPYAGITKRRGSLRGGKGWNEFGKGTEYSLNIATGKPKGCPPILDNHASKSAYWDKALTARSSVVRDSLPKDICPSRTS